MVSVRGTAFPPLSPSGGSVDQQDGKPAMHSVINVCTIIVNTCAIFSVTINPTNELSEWIGQELSKSDRPELTAARTVISGGVSH